MLRALESAVCDQQGMWLFFDKLIPPEEEDVQDKKKDAKKAANKGKGPVANPEDLKPTNAKGWINLIHLMEPGVKSLTQRVML